MALRVKCSNCGKVIRGGDDWAGLHGNCPGCGSKIVFPTILPPQIAASAIPDVSDDIPLMDPLPPPPPTYASPRTSPSRTCPSCGMQIALAANKCLHCGKVLGAKSQARSGSLMELKKIDIVSVAKIVAIPYLCLGFVLAIMLATIAFIDGISFAATNRPPHAPPIKPLVAPGWSAVFITLVAFPPIYALVGIVLGAITAGVYNFSAKLVGGIKLHLELSDQNE